MEMLPRLQAEELLGKIMITATGMGTMKKTASREFIRDLQKMAKIKSMSGKLSSKQAKLYLASLGIKVEESE